MFAVAIQALAGMERGMNDQLWVPNDSAVMYLAASLTYNDANWLDLSASDQSLNMVHPNLSKEVSRALRVLSELCLSNHTFYSQQLSGCDRQA